MMLIRLYAGGAAICLLTAMVSAEQRTQSFDADPGWDGVKNRIVPERRPTVTQDFGYADGKAGGSVMRASEPSFYADRIEPKTLDDKLSASGTFSITKTSAGGGVFFGFVNGAQPGAGGRPIASLGLDFDSEQSGGRLAVRLITAKNQSCGTFITPYVPGKFRPTSLRNDGTIYKWTLDYDPAGANGRGQFTFTIASDAHKPGELESPDLPEKSLEEARARFPSTTKFVVDLPEGYKQHGTTFDHFGMMNMMKPGGRLTIFFDDLKYLDRAQGFSHDPSWVSSGNRRTYEATDVGGAHNFGFSATNHAGGNVGEIGGTFWRAEKPWGHYANKLTPLSFNDRLEARGKVILKSGGPDADMCFGWFSAGSDDVKEYLGIHVGGPTRIGHAFTPVFRANEQLRGRAEPSPVMPPGKACDFSIIYDPAANNGDGAITATLAGESATLNLKPGMKLKMKDARFDHFGMFTVTTGGQMVKLFIDDLQYTAGPND